MFECLNLHSIPFVAMIIKPFVSQYISVVVLWNYHYGKKLEWIKVDTEQAYLLSESVESELLMFQHIILYGQQYDGKSIHYHKWMTQLFCELLLIWVNKETL